ncbi:hypothetical protein MKX01_021811 [Papaver californicum]|nr:hypothetical protein MKX01_021811 [Papaver californicum]
MGNLLNLLHKEPPPPMVLVPPLFDFPPLAARIRMMESSYDMLFGKLALKCLFEDYYEEARHFSTRIMLKPMDDPNEDLIATVNGPLNHKPDENIVGNALFRWLRVLLMKSCVYYPGSGFGAFGTFPLLTNKKRVNSEDYGVMGLRYGSENLSVGATLLPFAYKSPRTAWLVIEKDGANYKDLKNWSCAIGYGLGSSSPLSPSFNFCHELARSSQVKNPFEEDGVVGITNYIDFGFELQTRVDKAESANTDQDSTFQIAASWQANKNFLFKGKVGPLSSSIALAFKSWWKPSFTFSLSAVRDRRTATTGFGFGLRVEDLREARYQRADPNFVMLTPTKEHLAEGILWKTGQRPMLQSDVDFGNFDGLTKELRPIEKIL